MTPAESKALSDYATARKKEGSGDFLDTLLAVSSTEDLVMRAVLAAVEPHQAIALKLHGFQHALDVIHEGGLNDAHDIITKMRDELLACAPQPTPEP